MTKRQSQSLPPTVSQLHVRCVMDGLSFRVSDSREFGETLGNDDPRSPSRLRLKSLAFEFQDPLNNSITEYRGSCILRRV